MASTYSQLVVMESAHRPSGCWLTVHGQLCSRDQKSHGRGAGLESQGAPTRCSVHRAPPA